MKKAIVCHHFVYLLVIFLAIAALVGCGGGGGSVTVSQPTSTPPPVGTFSLSVSSASLPIAPGVSRSVQVHVNAQGGFTGAVSITASGLPTGVSVSPAPLVVNASQSGTLTITASASTTPGNAQVNLQGTSGGLQAGTLVTLTINPKVAAASRPFKLVGGGIERGFYDETRKLLFAANLFLNEVDVISGVDLSVQSRLFIPAPLGIDQMADGNTIVVGTATSSLYTINENTLASIGLCYPSANPPRPFQTAL